MDSERDDAYQRSVERERGASFSQDSKTLFRIRIFNSSGARVCDRSMWCYDQAEAEFKANRIATDELKIIPQLIVVFPEPVQGATALDRAGYTHGAPSPRTKYSRVKKPSAIRGGSGLIEGFQTKAPEGKD